MIKLLKIGDYLLIIIFFSLIAILILPNNSSQDELQIKLIVENKEYRYNISDSQTLTVTGKLGETVIEIKDGKIRFVSSPCPHKHCVKTGFIENKNEGIICLPNKVSVFIISGENKYDTVVW